VEIKIKQSILKRELGFIQGVTEKKTTIPVLSNLLIETLGENAIRIWATDLDVAIRCDIEAEVIEPGAICLQARRLADITRSLDECEMHFKQDKNAWTQLKAAKSSFKLPGIDRAAWPDIAIPKIPGSPFPAEVLDFMVAHTAFAITNEQSRFALNGAKFTLDGQAARMVTTDGHRLAFIEKRMDDEANKKLDTLVPKKALMEAAKIARDCDVIRIGEDDHHIFFETETRLLRARKLTGQFPAYENIMPKSTERRAVFGLSDMRAAVRRVALMADHRNRSMKLTFRDGQIELDARSSEEGEGNEIVKADYTGDEITLGFNWYYLADFLGLAGVDIELETEGEEKKDENLRLAMEFTDCNAATQTVIDGDSGYDFKYILMPLRI
jgi:DNA polymerase-3 subunit beta